MKFVPTDKCLYWWPVKVRRPDPEAAGKVIEEEFEMQFEVLDEAESERIAEERAALKTEKERVAHERGWLQRVCRNWRNVVDNTGAPVPFSAFASFLALPWARIAIYRAYGESLSGEESPALGN